METVTIYKAVKKIRENYYSIFAGTKIELGVVKPQSHKNTHRSFRAYESFHIGHSFYNEIMVGKSSGFIEIDDARCLADENKEVVLKIELGGEIWQGDAEKISFYIPEHHILYAGTEILSFEEI
jgi:hypothetical protein